MKTTWLRLLLAFCLLAPVGAAVSAQEAAVCDAALLVNGWARATPPGAPNSAAYGILVNLGDSDDTLIGAASDAAEAVELHEMVMAEGDVMQMRPIEGGIPVPAAGFTQLQPGGLHIMLINLVSPLAAGDMLDLVLTFEQHGDVAVSVPIRDVAAMDGPMGGAMHGSMAEATEHPPMPMAPAWDAACAGLHVLDPWARPAAAGMPNTAAYGLLLNLTGAELRVVGGATDAAAAVELHEMAVDANDVMRMRPIEGGFAVPAGGATVLAPGGLHLMVIEVAAPLAEGDTLDMTLSLDDGSTLDVAAPVRQPPEAPMPMGGM